MNFLRPNRELSGFLLVFFGAVCFSTKAIMVKICYIHGVSPITALALRMFFSLPFFMLAAFFSENKLDSDQKPAGKHWLYLFTLGIAGYYLSSFLDFQGLKYITASMERLILFVYPTMVVILSSLIWGATIGKKEVTAIILTYMGIFFVFIHDINIEQENALAGSLLVFASAFTYAVYLIGSGKLIPLFGTIKFTSYAMLVSSVAVLVHYFIANGFNELMHLSMEVYIITFTMAIIATVIPSFLLSEGIKRIGSERSSIIGSVGPVSTIVLAYIFLGELINVYQIVGTCLVLGGVLLISSKKEINLGNLMKNFYLRFIK